MGILGRLCLAFPLLCIAIPQGGAPAQ